MERLFDEISSHLADAKWERQRSEYQQGLDNYWRSWRKMRPFRITMACLLVAACSSMVTGTLLGLDKRVYERSMDLCLTPTPTSTLEVRQ